MSDTLNCSHARSRPRRGRPRAPLAARSTACDVLHVHVELTQRRQVFEAPLEPAAPREHRLASGAACRAWHMSTRRADPASLPALFAGMAAAASASTARPERASVDISRWVHPAPRASSCLPHRLTVARAHCRRLSELFNHRVEGAERAAFVTDTLSSARQRSSSSLRTRSSARSPRAAAAGPARAAAVASWPAAGPQAPRRPAGPMPAPDSTCVCLSVVAWVFGLSGPCRAEKAMLVAVPVACRVEIGVS